MSSVLVVGFLGMVAVLALVCTILAKWVVARPTPSQEAAPQNELSEAPLEARLTLDDFALLMDHPTLCRRFVRHLRRERRKVLRAYIGRLRRDFNGVCAEIKILMTQSGRDRSDLATVLLKERLRFKAGVIRAELMMSSEALGLASLDFDQVVDPLESIRLGLDHLRSALSIC